MKDSVLSASDVTYLPDWPSTQGCVLCHSFSQDHLEMLKVTNGLYSFKMGLHIFGVGSSVPEFHDLNRWNAPEMWKREFGELAEGLVFFAETIFGDQFFYGEDGNICIFMAETGHRVLVAPSFREWLQKLLSKKNDFDLDVFNEWQSMSDVAVQPGLHLCPRIPFCLGGRIEQSRDGYLCEAIDDMKFKGQLALQLKDLKPGDKVDLNAINLPPEIAM